MQNNLLNSDSLNTDERGISTRALTLTIVLLLAVGVAAFLLANIGDFKLFARLIFEAKFGWIFLALIFQAMTYLFTGAIWMLVVRHSKYHLSLKRASSLSLEQIAIDQFVPAGGVAGQTLIARSMVNLGMPHALAVEATFVAILSHHIASVTVAALALLFLDMRDQLTPIIIAVASIYFVISIIVISVTLLVAYNRTDKIPKWFKEKKTLSKFIESLNYVSLEKVFAPSLLIKATFLRVVVVLLDAVTLWVVMISLNVPVTLTAAFVVLIIGSISGAVTLMPGGVGGYEIGSTAALALMGVPVEAAIAGTVILRGLTLWLPIIPGIYFLRNQLPVIPKQG